MNKISNIIGVLLFTVSTFAQTITIPFTGDYADPSIVRVEDNYYMTHTSHSYYPGLLVWHSKNLKDWKPVCRALHKNVGTVWAPEIIYYQNKFYIYFPTDKGGNYVITADKPEGPWTDPVKLDVEGIDPGHIADSKGNRYLYVNGGRYVRLSPDGLTALSKEEDVYNGWQYPLDWAVECFCLESPKLTFKDGYYYLVSAQGGTSGPSTSHMAVVARSKSVVGPWENSPYNPLVHTYSPEESWVSKGHATLFEGNDSQWHIVYHAYDPNNRQMGRSTLLEGIKWTKDGWPVMEKKSKVSANTYTTKPNTQLESDNFNSTELKWQWCFWGLNNTNEYALENGALVLNGNNYNKRALMAIASVPDYEVSFKIRPVGNVETGVVLFYNEREYCGIGLKNDTIYGLSRGKKAWSEIPVKDCNYLKLRVQKSTISLAYSHDGKNWIGYPHGFDVSGYHTNMFSGFFSLKPSVLCNGEGKVIIDNFNIKTNL